MFNTHNRYAVAIKVDKKIGGHVPHEVSKTCLYFVKMSGSIKIEVIYLLSL